MTSTNDRRIPDLLARRWATAVGAVALSVSASARQTPLFDGDALVHLGFAGTDVVEGDFDSNGWPDLIVAHQQSAVRVVLALGRGVWAPTTSFSLGSAPRRLAAADVNGDGRLDVLASHLGTGEISVLLGNGDGTFQGATSMPVATASFTGDFPLATADIDGDSDLDVFAVTHDGLLRLVVNLGGGTFASAISVPVGASTVKSLATGDLDGDGDVDLALGTDNGSCAGGASVTPWLNGGTGSFVAGTAISLPGCANVVSAVDLDGDLLLDLAVCGLDAVTPSNNGYFRAWINQGGATFAAIPTSLAPTACDAVAMRFADLDGDGDADAVLSLTTFLCSVDDNMFVCENQSGAQFGPPVYTHTAESPVALALADFDGDSDVDVASLGASPAAVRVHFNRGDGGLSPQTDAGMGITGHDGGVVADFDGDGYDDLATLGSALPVVTIRKGSGSGGLLAPYDQPCLQLAWAIASADVDGDADMDLLVAAEYGSSVAAPMRTLFNDGTGSFTASPSALSIGIRPSAVAPGDVDGDGDLDAVVTSVNDAKVVVNDGAGNFTVLSTMAINLIPFAVALGDFDGNGTLDAVIGRYQGSNLAVRLNNGSGIFSAHAEVAVGSHVTSILAFDVDGDSDLDVVTARDPGGSISVLRNDGAANFTVAATFTLIPGTTQWSATSLTVLDVDADGDLDLAAALSRWSAACVLRNDGTGAFGDRSFVPGGFDARLVRRARLDAGGADDLILCTPSATTTARNSASIGEIVCTGEAPAAGCPCGNASPTGSASGCLNSFGVGGALRAAGSVSLSNDRLVLSASQLPPTTTVLFFQGTLVIAGGAGSAFGDGLRCAGGSVRRLGTRVASASLATLPTVAEPTISLSGLVTSPGTRIYQAWYRNAATYCTTSTFNLTNAARVAWTP